MSLGSGQSPGGAKAGLTMPAQSKHLLGYYESVGRLSRTRVAAAESEEWESLATGQPSPSDYADQSAGHGVTITYEPAFTAPHRSRRSA